TVLVRESGSVVTRDDLMREVWGAEWWRATKTLDMHISWLRRKLGDDATDPRRITTVRGVGFRFETGAASCPVRQRVLQATIITVLLAVLLLGIPLGYSWLQLQRQTLSNQANVILDRVRVDTETRLQEGGEIDEALLQRRVDEQSDLNIAISVTYDGVTYSARDPPGEEPVQK